MIISPIAPKKAVRQALFLMALPILAALTAPSLLAQEQSQKELAEELGAKANKFSYDLDDDGNVIRFAVSNHWGNTGKPGLNDEDIQRLEAFPKLQAIFLEKQPLTNAGYHWLKNLKNLEDVRFHYVNDKQWTDNGEKPAIADGDFALVVNDFEKPLKILQFKHLFAVNDTSIDQLDPQPELWALELDKEFAGPPALGFIKTSPKITNLQLHRTTMNDAQVVEVLQSLPNLEVLVLRPTRKPAEGEPVSGKTLRGFEGNQALKALFFEGDVQSFDGELEYLARIPTLRFVSFSAPEDKQAEVIAAMQKARPDVHMRVNKEEVSGTGEGWPPEGQHQQDETMRWGITY